MRGAGSGQSSLRWGKPSGGGNTYEHHHRPGQGKYCGPASPILRVGRWYFA